MYSGRDALLSVEQAISRLRADETGLDSALRSAIDEAARLRREEADGFRVLARIKLDGLASGQIVEQLDAIERQALGMIASHKATLEALAKRRTNAQAALDAAEATKHDRDEDLAKALEALDVARAGTAERVASRPDWQAAKAKVDEAVKVAEASESKAKVAETDLAEKREPYEADPLFMYLWRKKHGQAEDRSGNLVRFLDRKVAHLVGYSDARANYAMLQEIPLRLRQHADAKLADVDAARDALATVERKALVADGVEALETRVAAAQTAVKTAEAAIAKITAELHDADADREKLLADGETSSYGGAIELIAQGLAREDMRQLYQEAFRTPTPQDDQALNAIAKARQQLAQADQEVANMRQQIREAARRRTELEGARDRARQQGYDSPLGGFASQAIIAEVITGIIRGAMRGGDLDRVLRDQYRRREPRVDPDFGGRGAGPTVQFPSPWGSSGSGGPWGGGGSWGAGGGGGSWGGGSSGGGGGGGSSGGGGGGGYRSGGSF